MRMIQDQLYQNQDGDQLKRFNQHSASFRKGQVPEAKRAEAASSILSIDELKDKIERSLSFVAPVAAQQQQPSNTQFEMKNLYKPTAQLREPLLQPYITIPEEKSEYLDEEDSSPTQRHPNAAFDLAHYAEDLERNASSLKEKLESTIQEKNAYQLMETFKTTIRRQRYFIFFGVLLLIWM